MVEVEDIRRALSEQRPLFQPGDEISNDTFLFLVKLAGNEKDILFSDFNKPDQKANSYIYIVCQCPGCKKEYRTRASKTDLKKKTFSWKENKRKDLQLNLDRLQKELQQYTQRVHPELKDVKLESFCNECIREFHRTNQEEITEFFKNPLEWVNTHSIEEDYWQWSKIKNFYTFPDEYKSRPEGWKYCGVKFQSYNNQVLTIFDQKYQNWKFRQMLEEPDKICSSSKELLHKFLGPEISSSTTPPIIRKTVRMVVNLIDGLGKDESTVSLLQKTAAEIQRILDDVNRKPKDTKNKHVFTFGKYKDLSYHHVINMDPSYITWCLDNIPKFSLTPDEETHYKLEIGAMDIPEAYSRPRTDVDDIIKDSIADLESH